MQLCRSASWPFVRQSVMTALQPCSNGGSVRDWLLELPPHPVMSRSAASATATNVAAVIPLTLIWADRSRSMFDRCVEIGSTGAKQTAMDDQTKEAESNCSESRYRSGVSRYRSEARSPTRRPPQDATRPRGSQAGSDRPGNAGSQGRHPRNVRTAPTRADQRLVQAVAGVNLKTRLGRSNFK